MADNVAITAGSGTTVSTDERTINSVAGARKGFTTVEGDFTLTISLPETDPNTHKIEELYAKNVMFDVALVEVTAALTEWQIGKVIAAGCMFENVSTSYDANDKPMREYTAKFLQSTVMKADGTGGIIMRDGNYTVSVINS